MANRFWVGNSGNISDTAHWSATSGGAGGASVPGTSDDVFFDALSFTLSGQIVTIDVAANFQSMSWAGVTNNPSLAGTQQINLYNGSCAFVSGMPVSGYTGNVTFNSTVTGKTLTTAGLSFACGFFFQGTGGGWTLQDNLTTTSNIGLTNGTLDTNSKTVACRDFNISGTSTRTLTQGSSIFNMSRTFTATTTTNLTVTANTATYNMSAPVSASTFDGGGLTYNKVNFLGYYDIYGANTFTNLTLLPTTSTNRLRFESGKTNTITNFTCNGTAAYPSVIRSITNGSTATIAFPANRYLMRHTTMQDITVTGATSLTNIGGTNTSNNSGVTFVTKFELGRIKNDGSFNWYNTTTGVVTKVSG